MSPDARAPSVGFAEQREPGTPDPPGADTTGAAAGFDPGSDADADLEPDESPVRLRRELRRRIASVGDTPGRSLEPAGGSDDVARAFDAAGRGTGRPEPTGTDRDRTDPTGAEASGSTAPSIGNVGAAGGSSAVGGVSGSGASGSGASGSPTGSSGRHARRDGQNRPPRLDYVPRHAVRTPGPGSVSPTDLTEVFSRVRQDPTEAPRSDRPEPVHVLTPPEPVPLPEVEAEEAPEPGPPGKRVRVVLSSRKGNARPVRTVVDVQELTQVGEVLSTSLIRSQLALALRIGGIALIALGSLPAMFVIFPVLGRFELFGLRLPWLLLGMLSYPFLLLLGLWYARSAERLEQVFADHIQS